MRGEDRLNATESRRGSNEGNGKPVIGVYVLSDSFRVDGTRANALLPRKIDGNGELSTPLQNENMNSIRITVTSEDRLV